MSSSDSVVLKEPGFPGSATAPERPDRDYSRSPMIAFYELTRACDLVCAHCRACAQKNADPCELGGAESLRLVDQLAEFPEPPLLVLTGGDPLKRADVYTIIEHAVSRGLETAITPSPTPLVTREAVARLADAGIARMAVSVDGAVGATHDALRGVPGSFEHTRRIMAHAREFGLPIQVNTTVHPGNVDQLEAMAALLADERIILWSLFFIIPVGRATEELRLASDQHEAVFERLFELARRVPFGIKTTEAMHYRRFLLQKRTEARRAGLAEAPLRTGPHAPRRGFHGVNDGRGILFISHAGLIYPSGFLPIVCGMFPLESVVKIYQNSPVFRRLRDADSFEGKCGVCDYRHICGGSRARAFAVTGNPYAPEPDCTYLPPGWLAAGHAAIA
jgi:radical SAM protein